ncbi:MAG TPA: FAD-dependent oxidoreductase, partial [Candidatus Methanoperedens sp.]|nr:FAD-dependent oxidoreductase [Candidatus Methanoperedens sp.]
MRRDLGRLVSERFDLLIVGGGVHGAAAARAGALAGLSIALIDQGDFGHATSANSLKIIHGGLRHLQRGNLRLVREGVRARRSLLALFPGLVAPLPFLIPTRGLGLHGRPALAVALALNDLLSADRNRGLPAASRLPRGRVLGRAELARLAPGLAAEDITGGALWYDAIALDTERLLIALVLDAAARGACAANYLRAEGFLREGGAVAGVCAVDVPTGADVEIRARVTLNAAGPWLDLLDAGLGAAGAALPLTKAVNVFVGRRLFGECAVGLAGAGGGATKRFFFFVPWRGGTMIGTLYLPFSGRPESCAVTAADLELMVAEVNRMHPGARLTPDEVRFAHVGVMPLAPGTPAGTLDAGLGAAGAALPL